MKEETSSEQKENNKKPSEAVLLAEYQACQQDVNAEASSYWTLAAIFVGISSALLAGLIYAILSNNKVFDVFIESMGHYYRPDPMVWPLRIITTVLGVAAIAILYFLYRWERRVTFLQQVNFKRMRDIERELGMWKSRIVYGIDLGDKTISAEDKTWLSNYQLEDWRKQRKDKLYERSSRGHYHWILRVLLILWCILILSVWLGFVVELADELAYYDSFPLIGFFLGLAIIVLGIITLVRLRNFRVKE